MNNSDNHAKKFFEKHVIIKRKSGNQIGLKQFMQELSEIFKQKDKENNEAVQKALLDYLHVTGAILLENGGAVEVTNHTFKRLPKHFAVTAKRDAKRNSVTYSIKFIS